MGLMVGILVGALTLGSASPYLFNAFGGFDWRPPLLIASGCALAAAVLIGFAGIGPNRAPVPRFNPHAALSAWRDVPLRLANLGYLGHMWELYAMWAWIGVFFNASFALTLPADSAPLAARLAAFVTIAAGAIGSVGAGVLADRLGRTNAHDCRHGGQRHVRRDHRLALRRPSGMAHCPRRCVGNQHRRRFGRNFRRRSRSWPTASASAPCSRSRRPSALRLRCGPST